MSSNAPIIKIKLPHRNSTHCALCSSALVQWVTATWFRFNVSVICMLFVVALALGPANPATKVVLTLLSPLLAIATYYFLYVVRILCAFHPRLKFLIGFAHLAYVRLCSRFVAQAIELELPVWH